MDFVPKNKHPASGWMFEERRGKIQTKWKESWWWAQCRAVCLAERAKTHMGCPGRQTALYCKHILIHNTLTRKICRPFFSFQTRFLFPLLLSPLSPASPLILSACWSCQQVSMCQRRFPAANCSPLLNYWCLSIMKIVRLSMSICLEKELSLFLPPAVTGLLYSPPAII